MPALTSFAREDVLTELGIPVSPVSLTLKELKGIRKKNTTTSDDSSSSRQPRHPQVCETDCERRRLLLEKRIGEQQIGESSFSTALDSLDLSHLDLSSGIGRLEKMIHENRVEEAAERVKERRAEELRQEANKDKDFATSARKRNDAKEMEGKARERRKELGKEIDILEQAVVKAAVPWHSFIASFSSPSSMLPDTTTTTYKNITFWNFTDCNLDCISCGRLMKGMSETGCQVRGIELSSNLHLADQGAEVISSLFSNDFRPLTLAIRGRK